MVKRTLATQIPPLNNNNNSSSSSSSSANNNTTHSAPLPNHRELTDEEKEFIAPMIRVDQSGEVGAYYIYKGQIAVLGHDPKLRPLLEMMWDQERGHLELFSGLISEHRVRPSLLRPLWEVAGFAVGAGTALLGKEAAMACTEAVETVIGDHYNDQLRELQAIRNPNEQIKYLCKTVAKCRDEELEHHDIAVDHDARQAPLHSLLSAVIKQGCKTAIWVASRV
ncbi:ubiquinone biosynthesis protein COQ7-domain-containing protein [Mycotypha africana]|uniref:ubiquinone biosynthesis protein COQ7-domain-containing protein n=1 Tax=Mycotypha africana TaxID=64632 RepID=UPI002301E177|nr:ubiquinone biosynthesis protein COQ7-domain-containing protein [Mycotypha africana]KAI8982237.1 ubiquinone biosynthesis protein COQ7-domain-containing protein [Mycotypha africana]